MQQEKLALKQNTNFPRPVHYLSMTVRMRSGIQRRRRTRENRSPGKKKETVDCRHIKKHSLFPSAFVHTVYLGKQFPFIQKFVTESVTESIFGQNSPHLPHMEFLTLLPPCFYLTDFTFWMILFFASFRPVLYLVFIIYIYIYVIGFAAFFFILFILLRDFWWKSLKLSFYFSFLSKKQRRNILDKRSH